VLPWHRLEAEPGNQTRPAEAKQSHGTVGTGRPSSGGNENLEKQTGLVDSSTKFTLAYCTILYSFACTVNHTLSISKLIPWVGATLFCMLFGGLDSRQARVTSSFLENKHEKTSCQRI
jgi:hypothetical protein